MRKWNRKLVSWSLRSLFSTNMAISETMEPEVKTTYEYALDLKERLQSTCELAQIELQKSQIRQKKNYDRKTRVRIFEKGDEVLALLPTDSNKLLLQWKGPFEMLERVRADDYRVQLVGRTKTFHANMLKKYWSREHEDTVHVSHAMVLEPQEGDEDEFVYICTD